ncbi:MAG: hypothetical protein GW802_06970 [Armatimonadetes bacterium]|nr:hypothetical protein [Armatimonadota bacterium]
MLATASDRAQAGETRDNYTWDQEKDRGVTDTLRTEVLEALVALSRR